MARSDARRLQVDEQAREHRGGESAEALMALVVPAGQDVPTKADLDSAVGTLTARTDGPATKGVRPSSADGRTRPRPPRHPRPGRERHRPPLDRPTSRDDDRANAGHRSAGAP